jgi:bifunctional DNA-binding transcriptional regulator/antitoxin component of YhaV-PrlF toxin-antitoxin module
MRVSVKVQNDGQAVIPAEVIQRLGGKPGSNLIVDSNSDHAMLQVENLASEPHSIYQRDIPPDKSVQDFLDEYETKYQMDSEEFWRKYKAGELECSVEYIDWAGFYEHQQYLESIGVDPKTVMFERFVPDKGE